MKYFNNYDSLLENLNSVNLNYSVLTGLYLIKPSLFDFLNDPSQRYLYNSYSFWQLFIIELKLAKIVKTKKEH